MYYIYVHVLFLNIGVTFTKATQYAGQQHALMDILKLTLTDQTGYVTWASFIPPPFN